jgi:hypothetical protein
VGDIKAETTRTERPRVAFTPGSVQGVVTARKRHICQNHMDDEKHYIEPGDRYVANALPPDHPDIGNPGWWHLRVCLDCCPAEHDPRPRPAALGGPENPVDGTTHPCPTPGYAGAHVAVGVGAISEPYRCHGCGTWFVLPVVVNPPGVDS